MPISTTPSNSMEIENSKGCQSIEDMDRIMWFLEYSIEQNCFHVDYLERILQLNQNIVSKGTPTGYVIIAGPFKHEEAFAAIKDWAWLLKKNKKS